MNRIRHLFDWGVEHELVPANVYDALRAVRGLQSGRSEARETAPVRPVADAIIVAVRPHVSSQVRGLIDLQLLTGARPGELCVMRGCDLNMSGRIWTYTPQRHKTQHLGRQREIYLGPKAQELVRPFLKSDLQAYLFSAADADAERQTNRRRERQTPLYPSHAKRLEKKRVPTRNRPPRDHYDVAAYRRAISRACDQAFPLPENLAPGIKSDGKRETEKEWKARLTQEEKAAVQQWRRDHSWHPHQLRHNAATNLRRGHGVELARIILGHTTAFTTEIYAEVDRKQAMEVIGKIG